MNKSELAWTLADYESMKAEPPARVRDNPELSEGEMMSADEVAEFIKDSIATLRILGDKASPRYPDVLVQYKLDLTYLAEVGAVDEDDYNGLIDEANLRFPSK